MGIYLPLVQLCTENVLEVVWNSVVLGISVFVGVSKKNNPLKHYMFKMILKLKRHDKGGKLFIMKLLCIIL